MKKKLIILFLCVLFMATVVSYFIIINTAWYHWREFNNFKNDPRTYMKSNEVDDICHHMNELVRLGEMEYCVCSVSKVYPSSEIIKSIKEIFPSLMWIQIFPYEFKITTKSKKYLIKLWANKNDMILIKDYVRKIEKGMVKIISTEKQKAAKSLKNEETIYWDNNKQNIKATRKYIRKGDKLLPHGKWQQWYRNGNLASERIFSEGKLVSPAKVWHPNRRLKALIPYNSNGQVNGVAKWWNKKGELVQSAKHENSTGDIYTFYPNYAISSRMHFVNGKIKTTTYYSQDGKKITIHEYLKILNKVGYDTFP